MTTPLRARQRRLQHVPARLLAGLALAGALLAPAVVAGPVHAAAVRIDPGALERGADSLVAHLEGRTIVDGDIEITVRGRDVWLLGETPDGYLVQTTRAGTDQLRFVQPGAAPTVVVEDLRSRTPVLGGDGAVVTVVRDRIRARTSTVRALDSQGGGLLGTRRVRGFANVLDSQAPSADDATRGRVVLSTSPPRRTVVWSLDTGATERISRRAGYFADLAQDRLATFSKDPYRGGCSVLSTVTDPRTRLWRSCDERVEAVGPGGSRVATIPLLTDGLGSSRAWLRTTAGEPLTRYRVDGFFGRLTFESPGALLLDTFTKKSSGLVRCTRGGGCELAGDLGPGSPLL